MTPEERLLRVVMLRKRLEMRKERVERMIAINAPAQIIEANKLLLAETEKELFELEPKV